MFGTTMFARFHPRAYPVRIASQWREEANAEKRQTALEKAEFEDSRLSYNADSIDKKRALTEKHQELIAEAGKVLEAAIRQNGFTNRFQILIRGG